jgi:hypothetical protein
MNLALSVASTMGADAGTPAGAAGVGGVGLCMGEIIEARGCAFMRKDSRGAGVQIMGKWILTPINSYADADGAHQAHAGAHCVAVRAGASGCAVVTTIELICKPQQKLLLQS